MDLAECFTHTVSFAWHILILSFYFPPAPKCRVGSLLPLFQPTQPTLSTSTDASPQAPADFPGLPLPTGFPRCQVLQDPWDSVCPKLPNWACIQPGFPSSAFLGPSPAALSQGFWPPDLPKEHPPSSKAALHPPFKVTSSLFLGNPGPGPGCVLGSGGLTPEAAASQQLAAVAAPGAIQERKELNARP